MTREELHTFARAGVAQKIAGIERELATYHKEWPDLFMSATPPQLLKPELKNGTGNGHAPILPPRPGHATSRAAGEARIATVRALLASGPQSIADLQAALDAKGQGLSSTALQKVLRRDVHATVKRTDGHFYWSVDGGAAATEAPKKKRVFSEATRRKLSRALKRRWKSGVMHVAMKKRAAARGN